MAPGFPLRADPRRPPVWVPEEHEVQTIVDPPRVRPVWRPAPRAASAPTVHATQDAESAPPPAPAQVGVGARTMATWMGSAALLGLVVSVVGTLLLDPECASSQTIHSNALAGAPALASPTPTVTESPTRATRPDDPGDLESRATSGEPDAMRRLEVAPSSERTASQVVALAKGRAAARRKELVALADDLRSDLPLSADEKALGKMWPYAEDGQTATEALAVLATLHTPMAADLLHEIATSAACGAETREVARNLIHSKDVKDAASEALVVALDLELATRCEEIEAVLRRVREHGDTRSLAPLKELSVRACCGSMGRLDCCPCSRGVHDAMEAARGRPAPLIARRDQPRPTR